MAQLTLKPPPDATEEEKAEAVRFLQEALVSDDPKSIIMGLDNPGVLNYVVDRVGVLITEDEPTKRRAIASAFYAIAALTRKGYSTSHYTGLQALRDQYQITNTSVSDISKLPTLDEISKGLEGLADNLLNPTKRTRTDPTGVDQPMPKNEPETEGADVPMVAATDTIVNADFPTIYTWLQQKLIQIINSGKSAEFNILRADGIFNNLVRDNPLVISTKLQQQWAEAATISGKLAALQAEKNKQDLAAAAAVIKQEPTAPPEPVPPATEMAVEGPGSSITQSPPVTTHTSIAESERRPIEQLKTVVMAGTRKLTVSHRERPADQLVTAMLGTACVGDRRAPGCYHIPGKTNVPCTSPEQAVKGMCNFKTIAVPHENPVGNSDVFRVYRGLDVGAQIKLQLQRALIRYGYAAAILPVYSHLVLDRHFAVTKYPGLREGGNFIETARQQIGSNPENIDHKLDKYGSPYADYLVSPHYTRVLSGDAKVPDGILSAFRNSVPREMAAPIPDTNGFIATADKTAYAAFPIYWQDSAGKWHSNPAYVNEKYKEDGSDAFNKRRLIMLKRGAGFLLRAMQHLRNAMALYIGAVVRPLEGRLEGTERAQYSRDMVINGTSVPKGAFAFLSREDIDAIVALIDILRTEVKEDYFLHHPDETMSLSIYDGITTGKSYKEITQNAPNLIPIRKLVAYMEVLWSYWHDNNVIGKLRRRINFKTRLAMAGDTVRKAEEDMRVAGKELRAEMLQPYGWSDASLYGLVVAHLSALKP